MVEKQIQITSQSDIYTVAFADENRIVGGYANGDIRQWKTEEDPTMKTRSIRSLVVSRNGRWIVSGDTGKKAIVWDAATHKKVREFEHGSGVTAVDISNDGTKVVAGGWADTDTVRIFDFTSGTELIPPLSHSNIYGVKFSPDDSRFATVSNDSGVRIYSTHDGNLLFDSGTLGSSHARQMVTPLVWSSDGQQLFVASRGKIICFDVSNSSFSDWPIHEKESRVSVASNGSFIVCAAGKSVSLWDCVSHEQVGSIIQHNTDIYCVALSPSGRYLACGVDKNIIIHNLRDVLPLEYFVRSFPLVQVSEKTFVSWTQGDATDTERLLSEEIASTASPGHCLLASRALIRARLKHVAPAIEDSKESLRVRPSPIGYIAMAVALLTQGYQEDALRVFDQAFHDCKLDDIRFLLLLKSILVFKSGNREDAIARVELLAERANDDKDDDAIHLYNQVLGVMYMEKGDYERAIPLLERAENLAPKDEHCPHLTTIYLVFGWIFDGLGMVARQGLCDTLFDKGFIIEAAKTLLDIIKRSDEETQRSKATANWISDFSKKCVATLEHLGNEAFEAKKYDDAIIQYSAALSLNPPIPASLLVMRSKARATKRLWRDALLDANEAVKADPSSPGSYEAKYEALYGSIRYDEAIDAFNCMLRAIEQSHDPKVRELRKNYVSPSQTIAAIDSTARVILKNCPLVVIDVASGFLCDGPERIRIFKADPSFKELVLSMTRKIDKGRIGQVLAFFFRYVMFSHVWEGKEPLFQEVKSVWDLPETPSNKKLRDFCEETRRLGYKWAWSDTCCINKNDPFILNQSLMSMYKWYADSAATLVFLADVAHPSNAGDLTRSRWMTRAWTLQELLAPKIIFFYDSEWKPYLGNTGDNHKESREIIQELVDVIRISYRTFTTFSPGDLTIREKLRLASTRNATRDEDVAYSLIGIFQSDIRPHYGEGDNALGHLLEEIVARLGDVTVLAWSGKSSPYNSCLPASISVYNQTPYHLPSLEGKEMETYITEPRSDLSQEVALSICKQINDLPPARFAARRLHLPCIIFPVGKLGVQELRNDKEKVYSATVVGLGAVEFTTADNLPLQKPRKLVFAHPWIPYIRGPSDGHTWGSDWEFGVDSGSDSEHDSGSDVVHATPAPQVDHYTQALQMIARLGQPFNALLLVQQPERHYKRVATENEIVVRGLGTNITAQNIRTTVLEIL